MRYFFQKHSETAPNSISNVLVKCMKTEYFSDWGSNFESDFPTRQPYHNAVNHVLEKQIYIFLRIYHVYVFVLKITVLLETISRKMFYFIGK